MNGDDDGWLLDIAYAAREVESFIQGFDEASYMRDRKTQLSVLYSLAVIGEAVKQLSEGFRVRHPEMPWRQIAGMRDVVVHGYRYVDLEQTWIIASTDVPALLKFIEPLLPSEDG